MSTIKPTDAETLTAIEHAMERWHFARAEDEETLEEINRILAESGRLKHFNREEPNDL